MSFTNVRTPQELWDAALEIFDAAREIPPDERSRFVESRCAGDPGLLAEVRSLLHHLSKAGDAFLKPAEIGELGERRNQLDPLIGQTISAFTIQSVMARGGMGMVYLARQASPDRDVALKVLSPGFWSAAAERRFAQEAQILAWLQHPNIAQIYEAGSQKLDAGGVVRYFAMELVPHAKRISDFASEQKLNIKERLSLFIQVCEAVQYGHSKGIIHRDLKPANILVGPAALHVPHGTPQALVKVIDFGVARVVDSDGALTTMHTNTGQLIGTLAYMSPEQCAADPSQIDTTTDVYSLGVILFELMTGRMPYDVSSLTLQSASRVICEKEPTRPGELDRRIRGDLETIILKCLEKDRGRRYQSVSDLLRDIRSYLVGEPISATPPSAYTRFLRWAARHPRQAVTMASLAIAASIVGSALVSVWFFNQHPDHVELTRLREIFDSKHDTPVNEGDVATLYSVGGRILARWSVGSASGIRVAQLVERPDLWGGGKLVIIGFGESANSPFRGHLCAFNAAGSYTEPLWERGVEQELIDSLPYEAWPRPSFDSQRQYTSSGFSLSHAWLFDVFAGDDYPGPEVVAYFPHYPGSQGVLRVFDLSGKPLFHVWQDGGILDAAWLPNPGALVCLARKGDADDSEYGWQLSSNHPTVLFAIRPVPYLLDSTAHEAGWIYPTSELPWSGNAHRPFWYKLPCPLTFAGERPSQMWFTSPMILDSQGVSTVELHVALPDLKVKENEGFGFSVTIDGHGNIVGRSPLSDSIREERASSNELPDAASFQLLEWKEENPPCSQVPIEFNESGSQQQKHTD